MKWAFPTIWLGGVGLFFVTAASAVWRREPGVNPIMLLVPLVMLVFGAWIFRKLVWDLADSVQDGGSYLLVRKGAVDARVPLTDIMNVNLSQFTSPRRVTLRLRTHGALGDEIAFIPKSPLFQVNPFARNAIAEDLMRRVDDARREKAR